MYIIYICTASLRMHIYIYSTSYTRAEIWGDSETSPGHLQAERSGNSSSRETKDQLTFKRTFWSSRFWISMFLMVIPKWWFDFVHKDPQICRYLMILMICFHPNILPKTAWWQSWLWHRRQAHFYLCGAAPAWQHSTKWPPEGVRYLGGLGQPGEAWDSLGHNDLCLQFASPYRALECCC